MKLNTQITSDRVYVCIAEPDLNSIYKGAMMETPCTFGSTSSSAATTTIRTTMLLLTGDTRLLSKLKLSNSLLRSYSTIGAGTGYMNIPVCDTFYFFVQYRLEAGTRLSDPSDN
eukprot:scpid102409/ scgid11870/ 